MLSGALGIVERTKRSHKGGSPMNITKWVEDAKLQDYLYERGIKPIFMS